MKASDVVTPIRVGLRDNDATAGYRWSNDTVFLYLQMAQEEVIKLFPGASPGWKTITLSAADTLQMGLLPADSLRLVRVDRNMHGEKLGALITGIDKELLDRTNRTALEEGQGGDIESWAKDPDDLDSFHVAPAPGVKQQVRILYAKAPAVVTDLGDILALNFRYRLPLSLLVQSLCLMEDDPGADIQRGTVLLEQAYKLLGVTMQVDEGTSPKARGETARATALPE